MRYLVLRTIRVHHTKLIRLIYVKLVVDIVIYSLDKEKTKS
jgi:hypothetical protein